MCYHTIHREALAATRRAADEEFDVRDDDATEEYSPEEEDPEPDAVEAWPKPLGFA